MKAILFLDDDPLRATKMHDWMSEEERQRTVWCKTVKEAIQVLREYSEMLEEIYLDHDLNGEIYVDSRSPDCGMEVVRWFENIPTEKCKQFESCHIFVHTHNVPAGIQMTKRLRKLNLKVKYIPFGDTDEIVI